MKVAVIGCGVMGRALAKHFAKQNSVLLHDKNYKKSLELANEIGGQAFEKVNEAVQGADIVVLAVKPQHLSTVAKSAAISFSKGQLLISILAGTPLAVLKRHFSMPLLVRIMPNLAVTCGEGVIGFVEDVALSQEVKKNAESIFKGLGLLYWLPEYKIEALTSLAASGLAFAFVIIEAMIEGGVAMGFSSQESREIVFKTLEGSIALLKETGKHPAELKLQCASPKGTTIAGLREMEETGVRSGIMNTLMATYNRAKEMYEEHQ